MRCFRHLDCVPTVLEFLNRTCEFDIVSFLGNALALLRTKVVSHNYGLKHRLVKTVRWANSPSNLYWPLNPLDNCDQMKIKSILRN